MTVTHAHEALEEAFAYAIEELDGLIGRHFTASRTLVVSNDEVKFWTAAIGDDVLYRSPDGAATLRFARTFAERTAGVVVEVEAGFSVRAGTLSEGEAAVPRSAVHRSGLEQAAGASPAESVPGNVVPIRAEA